MIHYFGNCTPLLLPTFKMSEMTEIAFLSLPLALSLRRSDLRVVSENAAACQANAYGDHKKATEPNERKRHSLFPAAHASPGLTVS